MREIKCRVWDKGKKVFIPADVYGIITSDFGAFGVMLKDWEDYKEGEYFYPISQALSQFTGLKDKNGTEIYHKDLLEDSDGRVWLVDFGANTFDNTIASWTIQTVGKKGRYPIDKSVDNFQVIGNIYENPELLQTIS